MKFLLRLINSGTIRIQKEIVKKRQWPIWLITKKCHVNVALSVLYRINWLKVNKGKTLLAFLNFFQFFYFLKSNNSGFTQSKGKLFIYLIDKN